MIDVVEYFKELDTKYPNRHKQIHKGCCKHCPSDRDRKSGIVDPESEDFKKHYSKEFLAKEVVFVCAWRNSKLCKGICDYFEITEELIKTLEHE